MERYGSVAGHYGTLQNITEALRERYRMLRSVTEYYEALPDVKEALRSSYGTLWNR